MCECIGCRSATDHAKTLRLQDAAADYNYFESYGKLHYILAGIQITPRLEVGLYYSPDYFGEDVDRDQTSGPVGYDYVHYAIGVSRTMGQFSADLAWQGARDLSACTDNCEAVVLSVSSRW